MQHLHGFCIVTKLTKANQNITIVSKNMDWVRSFHFWIKTVHRFVNDPNGCIKCNICVVFCTVTKLTKTNQNITIGSKNVDWVRSFRFWIETVHRFVNYPNGCIQCNICMVFCTVTKLTKTNQNITIWSKNLDWVRSFRFWIETVHRFVNDPNGCIKCNICMVFCTVTKLTKTNQNITIGSKNVDWVRSFRFWIKTVHRFVNDPNGCIKCNICVVFCTVTKLTKTNQNITLGSKNVDWVRSFRFWPETVHRFVNDPNGCIKCNICMVFFTVTKLTKPNQNITIGSKNVDWVRSFRLWLETVHRFVYDPNGCIKCNICMVFCTVTKLTKTIQNITIGSKNVDWVCSFRFWPETMRRFINGLNRCIKSNPGMVFYTVTKLTKTNQNITIGSKNVDWVRSFRFWIDTVHHFVNDPNR